MPTLISLTAQGWTEITTAGEFEAEDSFRLIMSGATELENLKFKSEGAVLDLSGGAAVKDIDATVSKKISLDFSGATNVDGFSFEAEEMKADVSGAANVYNGTVNAETVTLRASGASNIKSAKVALKEVNIGVSGAARVDLSEFLSKEVIVEAGGVAKVDFNATEKATYSSSGQATVRPHGKGDSVKTENGRTTVRIGYDD